MQQRKRINDCPPCFRCILPGDQDIPQIEPVDRFRDNSKGRPAYITRSLELTLANGSVNALLRLCPIMMMSAARASRAVNQRGGSMLVRHST
jgi:hypothetical protein